MTEEQHTTRWQQLTGGTSGAEYAARFEALAAGGQDVHGEATFCAALVSPGSRVLDAGCGTGRVGARLAELGCDVVGIDVDESMLAVARRQTPSVPWLLADVSAPSPDLSSLDPFDLVVLAGNVVPLLAPGRLPDAVRTLAGLLAHGGLVVAGFGLDAGHLPAGCPVTPLSEYDAVADAHGLELVDRHSTWDALPYDPGSGYAVSVHRRR